MKSRNANYKLLEVIKLFVPANGSFTAAGTGANIKELIEPTGDIGDVKDYLKRRKRTLAGVGAPMVLARLCALFEGLNIHVYGQTSYKVTWEVILVHHASGHRVTFYDYKGGISYGSDVFNAQPKEFIRDLKQLISVLKDPRCPHPYDGCVVGEEA